MKALFIPLKGEYFDAFARGEKRVEYRQRGKRWNLETCAIGRRVVLSRGYGTARRLSGKIVRCSYDNLPSRLPGWLECYGPGGCAVCIEIELDELPFVREDGFFRCAICAGSGWSPGESAEHARPCGHCRGARYLPPPRIVSTSVYPIR